ncbi:lipase family protein [Streptomyces boncukensis]|uniref:Lipase family protein n=1 Tax=Streptomyces boncukensis TaxID=2711219 RepID=A0A6G4X2Q6_9ACTN|nr:lipase family protein [Streptomyces boncukensis]NGO71024.1 lipase family protein [Streptomyces boncukensis]
MSVPALDHRTTGYSLPLAYWLARASELAYKDEPEVRERTGQWGFTRVRYLEARNPGPLPLTDTQAFVAGSDHMVVVAFRGTEPTQARDWLSDVDAPGTTGPGGHGMVHVGFAQALDVVHQELTKTVEEFRDQDQTLWITGHSLGAALAMLAAARLHFEAPGLLADGVHTFGQPRTGDRDLADAYDAAFTARHFRFVNNNDVVPQLPPEPLYHHVKALRYFDADGNLHESMSTAGNLADHARGFAQNAFAPGTDAIQDHRMTAYLPLLEKAAG